MNLNKNLWFCCVLLSLGSISDCIAKPTAKVTIRVVDDKGALVEGAQISVNYINKQTSVDRGLSDSEGEFTAAGGTYAGVSYRVKKEGYYTTRGEFTKFTNISGFTGFRRWQPWNPTISVVLKKKRSPIALYATKVKRGFPALDEFIGFDLLERDWVAPRGFGKNTDILFKFERVHYIDKSNWRVKFTIDFPNEGDGIQMVESDWKHGSELKLPHHAPTGNYQPKMVFDYKKESGKNWDRNKYTTNDNHYYFFRVRSKLNDDGELESAVYGKTKGPLKAINFAPGRTVNLHFSYYLNPEENDTNLEFDITKNLFKGVVDRNEFLFLP